MKLIRYVEPKMSLSDYKIKPQGFFYERVVFLPENAYKIGEGRIFRGEDLSSEKRPFVTKTHYRIKYGNYNGFYTPAFRPIFEEGEKEVPVDIEIGVNYDSLIKLQKLSNGWFVDYPTGKYEKNKARTHWEFKYDDDALKSSLGAIHTGFTKIIVKKNGELYDHERELIILPSSVSFREMVSMIHDIYYIRQSLVSLDNAKNPAKTAIPESRIDIKSAVDWYNALNHIKGEAKKLFVLINKIGNNYHKGLVKHYCKVPSNKIKKVTPNIIEQYLTNPCRDSYNVDAYTDSIDIYEHKLIKFKINELYEYLKNRNKYFITNNKSKKNELLWQMNRLLGNDYTINEDEILENVKTAINNYDTDFTIEREKIEKKLFMINSDVDNIKKNALNKECIYIKFDKADIKLINFREGLFQLVIKEIADKHIEKTFECYRNYYYSGNQYFGEKVAHIKLESSRYNDILSIYHAIEESSQNNTSDSLNWIILNVYKENNCDSEFLIKINNVDLLLVNGNNKMLDLSEEDAFQELKNIYIDNNFYIDKNESSIINYYALKHLYNQFLSIDDNYLSAIYNETINALEKILKNTFLSTVKLKPTKWKMTQIFTNDSRYHKVYKVLKTLDKLYDFSFNFSEDMILHNKLELIYEYWIIARILDKLVIDLKWEPLNGNNSVYDIFNDFFDVRDININSSKIVLHHKNKTSFFELELYYDTQLQHSVSDLFTKKFVKISGRNTPELRPDFLFKIKDSKNNIKVFTLDAKYKNFLEMGNEWLDDCLKDVCASKYIEAPQLDVGLQVSAAFIVHPDRTPSINNPNKYLDQYVTYNAACDERCIPILDAWQLKFGNNYQIGIYPQVGSFYLSPNCKNENKLDYLQHNYKNKTKVNNSDRYLTMFIQMIFEYYFNDWKECWSCGSNDVTIKKLYTQAGYAKYHIHCNKCGAFWVKNHCSECGNSIIKHYVNYQIEEERNTWLLRCPRCKMNKKNTMAVDSKSDYYSNFESLARTLERYDR